MNRKRVNISCKISNLKIEDIQGIFERAIRIVDIIVGVSWYIQRLNRTAGRINNAKVSEFFFENLKRNVYLL